MPTVTKTFVFSGETWTDEATGLNMVFTNLTTDGNPANCGQFHGASLLHGQSDRDKARIGSGTDTWETLFGVPSGATVTSVQITGYDVKCVAAPTGTGPSASLKARVLDSGFANVCAADLLNASLTTGPAGIWATSSGGSSQTVNVGKQASSTVVYFELEHAVTQGSTGSSNPDYRFDNIVVVVTYTAGGGSVSLSGVIAGTERFAASPGLLGGSVGITGAVAGAESLALALHSGGGFQFPFMGRDPAFAAMTTTRKRGLTFDTFGIGSARRGFGGPTFLHTGGGSGVNQVQFTGFGRNASRNFTAFSAFNTQPNDTPPFDVTASGSLYFSQQTKPDGPSWTTESLVDGPGVVTEGCGGGFLGGGYFAVYQKGDDTYFRFTSNPSDWSLNAPVLIENPSGPTFAPLGAVRGAAVNSMGQIAVLSNAGNGSYVSVSSDRGQTWQIHYPGPPVGVYCGISAMHELFIVCAWAEGFDRMIHYISKDAGATWL